MQASALLSDIMEQQLSAFSGDPRRPIYVAISGTVYDVSPDRPQNGPGGRLARFAGVKVTDRTVDAALEPASTDNDLTSITIAGEPLEVDRDTLLARVSAAFAKKVTSCPILYNPLLTVQVPSCWNACRKSQRTWVLRIFIYRYWYDL